MKAWIWRWWNGREGETIRMHSPRWKYWNLRLDLRDWWKGAPPKTDWYELKTDWYGEMNDPPEHVSGERHA